MASIKVKDLAPIDEFKDYDDYIEKIKSGRFNYQIEGHLFQLIRIMQKQIDELKNNKH